MSSTPTQITLYHNPNCSKSRATLALLEAYQQDHAAQIHIVEYLQQPLNLAQLETLHQQLGGSAHQLVRTGDAAYQALGLTDASSDHDVLTAIADNPTLLQRPVAVHANKAAIGRPPEQVLALLPQ